MPSHMVGHEGNLLVGTQIQNLRMSGSLDGALGVPAIGHPLCYFVSRFVRLGVALTRLAGFAFDNHGTHFGYVYCIP
jgi:hypothetical protein